MSFDLGFLVFLNYDRDEDARASLDDGLSLFSRAEELGYDSASFRYYLRARGIRHSIPLRRRVRRRFQTHAEISSHRWKVERFFAWLNGFRRLGIRFERHALIYEAFLTLAAIMITLRYF